MNDRAIFLAALEIADREARATYLDEACAGDDVLRVRVEALLKSHQEALGQQELGQSDTEEAASSTPGSAESADVASTLAASHLSEGPGSVIGAYKLLQKLGEGGMGVVYLAEQREPVARKVALKIIKPGMDSAHVIARFEHERQALAMMDHPNIAKVLDAGTTETGRPFFVMELVKGIPITRFCDQEHLTPRERLELFIPVCHAVQHAHQKGIIHRDLKPSNVLVALYDGKAVPKIIDFGVAKATSQRLTERTMYTAVGSIVGTLEYMAPEQAELNNLDIDTRADIYSLGAILYELLTGAPPFTSRELRGAAFTEMMRIIREVEPAKPSTKVSSSAELPSIATARKLEPKRLTKLLSGDLDWIVLKCLEKDRARRYETASSLAADIGHYLADEPVSAGRPSAAYRMRKFLRRNKGPVLAASGILLVLVSGIVATSWQAVRANRERAIATKERDDKQMALAAETQARRQAMTALRSLTDEIVQRQLARQPTLSDPDREFLQKIVEQYEAFAAVGGEAEEPRAVRAEGHLRIGVLRSKLGQGAEALASLRRARELYLQLAADFPAVPRYRQELARSHNSHGILLREDGKDAQAEAEYLRAVALEKQLVDDFPNVPDYRDDLATSQRNLGNLLADVGKYAEAEAEYSHAIALHRQLVDDFPKMPNYRQELATSQANRATLLKALGKRNEAEGEYRQAVDVQKQLADDFPNVPEYRVTLAYSHTNLGNVLHDLGKHKEAKAEYGRALALLKHLAAEFPTVPLYRGTLASIHSNLANQHLLAADYAEAADYYRQAIALQSQLAADFPAVPGYALDLGGTQCNFGFLLLHTGNPDEALKGFQQAIQTVSPVLVKQPKLVRAREFLHNCHAGRAKAFMQLARFAEAVKDWERVIELDEGPPKPSRRLQRASCLARIEPLQAVAEVEELVQGENTPADLLFEAACVCSLASAHTKDDAQREKYAVRAIALLNRARAGGHFYDKAWPEILRRYADLKPLRGREDFAKLVAEVQAGASPKKEAKMP